MSSQLYFSHIRIIWKDANGRLCAMEPNLQLERFQPTMGLKPVTARSAGQGLTH